MEKLFKSIRGTCDFDPLQAHFLHRITQRARKTLKQYGYQEIILPILEEEGLFRKGVGEETDIVEKQMFKVEDKNIVLRPEGTAQVIRYYLENSLHKQSDFHKFFYIGAMFRGERPQRGRLRQFHHIGVEALGSGNFYLDAEIIGLASTLLDGIGIEERELKINNLGCWSDKQKFSQKLKKLIEGSRDQLCHLCQKRYENNPLKVLDCKSQECKEIVQNLQLKGDHLCSACESDFKGLLSLLSELKINYIYTPALVRGLDYYTNTVFEIASKKLGSQDALGAGGRYNNLVKNLGGPDIPALGFALGVERLLLILHQEDRREGVEVFVAVATQSLAKNGFKVLHALRQEGISSEMDYCRKSLKGQLRLASKLGAEYVAILGDQEWQQGELVVKDMKKGIQERVSKDCLITFMKERRAGREG